VISARGAFALGVICALAAPSVRSQSTLPITLTTLSPSARVLVIAAHPDDEDTRLITWLTKGRQVETAYLSLTRGDGGQNLIGNELGEALGVIRTEELLAARRIDGATQYFTRAYDFGFSKSAAEAYTHWPHDSVLQDVITVVRAFKPHIIVSVFSGTPRDGHGQHQVAGLLAREAYDLAGDTVRFPRSRTAGLGGWTALKFYRTTSYWNGEGATLFYNAGEYNPLLGRSYAEIAGESRSQHKSQAFGVLQRKGFVQGSLRREDSRVKADADGGSERSLFDGIDTTWARVAAEVRGKGARGEIEKGATEISRVQRTTNLNDPSASVDALVRAATSFRAALDAERALPAPNPDAVRSLGDGLARLSRAIILASGVSVEATTDRDVLALGDSATVQIAVYNRGRVPVTATAEVSAADSSASAASAARIAPDSVLSLSRTLRGTTVTSPWWLRSPRNGDLFTPPIDGRTEQERTAGITARVMIDGVAVYSAHVVHRYADPVKGEIQRPLAVAPAVTLTLERTLELARADAPQDRLVRVTLRSASSAPTPASGSGGAGAGAPRSVKVSLTLPPGLTADSASRQVDLPPNGVPRVAEFRLRGKVPPGRYSIAAVAQSGGQRWTTGYTAIEYEHIRPQALYRDAAITLSSIELALPPRIDVAYIPGVGDNVAPTLQQLGVPLTVLDPARLSTTDLSRFTTVVIGPRAYESQPELVTANARLLEWVRGGGTMVVQYGQYEMMQPGMMPFEISISRPHDRVTDENAPVKVLRPDSPLLSAPNRIGDPDWRGWVQERALYMPHTFASQYESLLSMNDPGEPPNAGALLVAPYGRGRYVYTTLALFRQLPAGVPGGARLFVNLLAPAGSTSASAPTAPATP